MHEAREEFSYFARLQNLHLEDIEVIIDILKAAGCSNIELSDQRLKKKFIFDSVDDIIKHRGKLISHLNINGKDPSVHIEIVDNNKIYCHFHEFFESDKTKKMGAIAFYQLKDFFEKKKRNRNWRHIRRIYTPKKQIFLEYSHNRPNFFSRNKDHLARDAVKIIFGSLVGAVVTYLKLKDCK